MTKVCSSCKEEKYVSDFYVNSAGSIRCYCKPCYIAKFGRKPTGGKRGRPRKGLV